MKKSVRSLALLSTAALALGMGISGGANAAPAQVGEPQILAKDLAGPLTTAVAEDGTAYVTANFGGSLWKVAPGGDPEVVFQSDEKGAEVGGVSVQGTRVVFTHYGKTQKIYEITGDSAPKAIANLGKYEKQKNPDKGRTYGFYGISKSCAATLPKDFISGAIHGHRRLAPVRHRAGRRHRLRRRRRAATTSCRSPADGEIRKVAVLPPTKVKATKAIREGHRAARVRHRSQVRPRARADRRRDGTRRLALRLQPARVDRRTAASAPRAGSTR